MFDWNHIQSFLAVVDHGTLSRAAEHLKLSQPTLGRHISDLERATGVTLFVRGRQGTQLTEAGLSWVEDARAMQAEANRLATRAAGQSTSLRGTVRITASDIVATYFLPSILQRLREAEPEIDIELVPSNTVENLLSRDADIAVRMVRPTQNDIIARKANDMTMGIFAHSDYLSAFGTPNTLSEFLRHQIVGMDRSSLILDGMQALGIDADRSLFAFRTDDQVAYWELIKAAAGIGFGSRYLATLSAGLVQILPDIEIPSLPMWLASHQELRTNLRIRRASDFLYEELANLPLNQS